MPIAQPPLTSPTRFSFGTRTSEKNTSQKCEMPLISSIGRTSIPGVFMSTSRKLIPRCLTEVSVRASRKHQSE